MEQRFKSNMQKYTKVQSYQVGKLVGKNQQNLEKVKMHKKHEALAMREKLDDYTRNSKIREQEVEEKKMQINMAVQSNAERRRLRSQENK